jgi:hypothetical protein
VENGRNEWKKGNKKQDFCENAQQQNEKKIRHGEMGERVKSI